LIHCIQREPVARTASAWPGSMDSISSASNLDRNPIVAKESVTMPANGPKPNMATQKMAMMISWKLREMAMMPRQSR
jgi:hypothetical protein